MYHTGEMETAIVSVSFESAFSAAADDSIGAASVGGEEEKKDSHRRYGK